MKHYPAEIAHKTFEKKMMGYDPDDVSDFLTIIAAQMEALLQERSAFQTALKEKELQLLEYKDRDHVLKATITSASQMAEKMRSDAEREAKLIINDAQQKAEMITRDAKDSLKKSYQDVADLKKARMQFEANLKAMAQAHLSLLEQGESFMPRMRLPDLDIK
ncbi:MAG: cell division protein DivIVA [Bdellovibrionales bacterium RIFCSPHIGHO2_01_FULL_40_29]|nr:MAG: cell division protein DivIVA [Bdellovibrionales bacterium RIFCSPHIGHO2_01_FULL_40_29]OFZ35394.1 MAG: cell division protein DivIVA [Bdellovibrionales bacterium RIFCSPHIGHO2_02_FULL_40_15]